MTMITLLLATWLTLSTRLPQAPDPDAAALEAALRKEIAVSGAEVAVAFRSLDGGREILIDPDRPFHAASTMKVPVMIELFRQAHAGSLTLDDPLAIRNSFHSIVDGSPYALSEGDDSDKAVYAATGKTLTLRQLCAAMITVSSNFAANLLIEKLGADSIQRTVAVLGAAGCAPRVEDQKRSTRPQQHDDRAGLLAVRQAGARAGGGRAVGCRHDRDLKRQAFNDGIPAGLPRHARRAQNRRHPHPSRRRRRLRRAAICAGRPGARPDDEKGKRSVDRRLPASVPATQP